MLQILKKVPSSEKRITLSTIFTILRIVFTQIIVVAMIWQHWGLAFWLFLFASLTDIIDGSLARFLNEKTFLGTCLDPIADKLLIISCFATLAFVQSPLFSIPRWFVFAVLFKELVLIVGIIVVYYLKGSIEIKPTELGKITMFVQVCFIIWLFACYFFNWLPIKTYWFMLGLLMFLVFSSLIQYMIIGLRYLYGR